MGGNAWKPGQHIAYDDGTYLGVIVEVRGVMITYTVPGAPPARRQPMVTMHEVRRVPPPD